MVRESQASPPPLPPLVLVLRLTRTEKAVLRMVGEMRENKEIAGSMFRSRHTVKVHLKHLHAKLGTKNRAHLAATAIVYGLARLPDQG